MFLACLAAIALLSVVAFRHPDGFHALPISQADEVAHRPIHGNEFLLGLRQTGSIIFRQLGAERIGQGRNLVNRFNPLPIQRLEQLAAPISGLAGFHGDSRKLLKIKA